MQKIANNENLQYVYTLKERKRKEWVEIFTRKEKQNSNKKKNKKTIEKTQMKENNKKKKKKIR